MWSERKWNQPSAHSTYLFGAGGACILPLLCATAAAALHGQTYTMLRVRDRTEWSRISAYMENNPVKAGFVARSEDYQWASQGPARVQRL